MNELKQIMARLMIFENGCDDNYGLHHGKTGLGLAYHLIAKFSGDGLCLGKAKALLDDMSENIDKIRGFDFENGLAGVGWGVEWLIQNKFIDANSDEILGDLDDELYKNVVYNKSPDLSFRNGTIGKGLFFYKRLQARNPNASRYRNICNQECLILLLDELTDTLLPEKRVFFFSDISQDFEKIDQLAETLLFLAKISHTKIYIEIVKRITCAISKFMEQYFSSDIFKNNKANESDLFLIYACYKAGLHFRDGCFTDLATRAYHLWIEGLHEDITCSVCRQFIFQEMSKLTGITVPVLHGQIVADELDVFTILKEISALPGSSNYNWEEGWGL